MLNELSTNNKEYAIQSVKLKVLDYMIDYVNNPANAQNLVPSNLMIEEPSLVQQISELNKMQLQKETLLKNTTPANSLIVNLQTSIDHLRNDIQQNLKNVRSAYVLALSELENKNRKTDAGISGMPAKEK